MSRVAKNFGCFYFKFNVFNEFAKVKREEVIGREVFKREICIYVVFILLEGVFIGMCEKGVDVYWRIYRTYEQMF